MFLTITIDTAQTKKSKVRIHRKTFTVADGFRKSFNMKKRSLWQRMKAWRRNLRGGNYRLENPVKVSSTVLSRNFDPHVQFSTLRSKFPCRLVSDTFTRSSEGQSVMF